MRFWVQPVREEREQDSRGGPKESVGVRCVGSVAEIASRTRVSRFHHRSASQLCLCGILVTVGNKVKEPALFQ